jgi:protein TonB
VRQATSPIATIADRRFCDRRFCSTIALARRSRLIWSIAAASAVHALLFLSLIITIRDGSTRVDASAPLALPEHLVWLAGAGGGGGGGGNGEKTIARRLERSGHDRASIPGPAPDVTRLDGSHEPDPIDRVVIPIEPLGDALASMPGMIDAPASRSTSLGTGRGPGAGTGDGGGIGPGHGNGLDAGENGGAGDGPYGPGGGVTMPVPVRMDKPRYSADAMRARIQGVVVIECIVRPNGQCSDVHVARSLDRTFGLDEEATRAVMQWRFRPGMRRGQPVPVTVQLELEFTIR